MLLQAFWLALKIGSQWRIAFVPQLEERKEKIFDLPMRGIHVGQVAWKKRQYKKGLLDQLSALLTQHQAIQGFISHRSNIL